MYELSMLLKYVGSISQSCLPIRDVLHIPRLAISLLLASPLNV